MRQFIILARSSQTADAVQLYLDSLHINLCGECNKSISKTVPRLVVDYAAVRLGAAGLFDLLAERLSSLIRWEPDYSLVTTVIVDRAVTDELNPLGYRPWESTLAMLVLAFPEIEWKVALETRLLCPEKQQEPADVQNLRTTLDSLRTTLGLSSLQNEPLDPLFDANGLRNFVLENAKRASRAKYYNSGGGGSPIMPADYIQLRTHWGVSLEDEIDYAYLHSYALYRNGVRAIPLYRWQAAHHVLNDADLIGAENRFLVSVEDHSMSFPDAYEKTGLSVAEMRLEKLKRLERSDPVRMVVTADMTTAKAVWTPVPVYQKPLDGIFGLWAKIKEAVEKRNEDLSDGDEKCKLPTFAMIPPAPAIEHNEGSAETESDPPDDDDSAKVPGGHHSAPGRLTRVASSLLQRARALNTLGGGNLPHQVRGAVLARLALQVTGGRTPTLSVEALSLLHVFETEAECCFSGVSYDLSIDDRISEIRDSVNAIHDTSIHVEQKQWRTRQKLNNTLLIYSNLLAILSRHSQYDEERTVLVHQLRTKFELWRSDRPRVLRWVSWCAHKHIVRSVESLGYMFRAFVAMIAFAGIAYYLPELILGTISINSSNTLDFILDCVETGYGLVCAANVGVTADPISVKGCQLLVKVLFGIIGVANLGIVISTIYDRLRQK